MSTTIYKGLMIDTPNIFEFTEKLHTAITEKYHELAKKLVMEEVSHYLHNTTKHYNPNRSLITNVEDYWIKNQKTIGEFDDFYDPLRFQLCFGQSFNGKILAVPFYLEKQYKSVLKSLPEVKEYGYWNNTDREEGVSQKEWKLREQEWDSILSEEDNFVNCLNYTLNSKNPFTQLAYRFFSGESIEDWLIEQPTPEQRLRTVARQVILKSPEFDKGINMMFKVVDIMDKMPIEEIGILPEPITKELLVARNLSYPFEVNLDHITQHIRKQIA